MVREEAPELMSTAQAPKAPPPAPKAAEADAPRVGALKPETPKAEAPKSAAPKPPEEPKADLNALAMRAPAASGERAKLMKEQAAQPPKEEARARSADQPSFVPDPAPASNRAATAGVASSTPPPVAAVIPQAKPAPQMAQRRFDEGARDRAEQQVLSEATAKRMQDTTETPEKWLERIAQMRSENKHEEADKALAEFRKRHPDYRISDSMLQRVERRGFAR
jgi:hypothetical protein